MRKTLPGCGENSTLVVGQANLTPDPRNPLHRPSGMAQQTCSRESWLVPPLKVAPDLPLHHKYLLKRLACQLTCLRDRQVSTQHLVHPSMLRLVHTDSPRLASMVSPD